MAADVSYATGREGQGGWSWYTGAAGWYWQVAVQELLGLKVKEGHLRVQPRLPSDWPGYQAEWRLERGTLLIRVERGEADAALLDGQPVDEVALKELEGEHHLRVVIP